VTPSSCAFDHAAGVTIDTPRGAAISFRPFAASASTSSAVIRRFKHDGT
jgi:hypothetical protein